MNKEKLVAARKKLKEYQKNKKEHSQENHSSQQNETSVELKSPEQVLQNDHTAVPSENQSHLQHNAEQYNESNSPSVTDNSHNINILQSENNNQTLFTDNMFHTTECQTFQNQNPFIGFHEERPSNLVEKEQVKENFAKMNMNLEENQHEEQINSAFASVKDSFIVQKNQILQTSHAIQDAFNDKSDDIQSHDEIYNPNDGQTNTVNTNAVLLTNLQEQVLQYKNRVHELENILQDREAKFHERLSQEVSPLQEQLQIHAHTTNILVSEKAELSSILHQHQLALQQKSDEVEDLSEKLKASQSRISELEKEISFIRSNNNDVQKACQQLQNRYDELSNQFLELRKTKEDLELESSELKQKLNINNMELSNLQQELQEKAALLSLSDLKIQQLTNSPQEIQTIDNQHNPAAVYEQQIIQLKETIKNLTDEKSDAGKQYKNYVQQLDERHMEVTKELEMAMKRIAEFEGREESYIQRLSDLEQQLQKERVKIETFTPVEDYQARIDVLTKNIDHLVLEQESLQTALTNKDAELEQLKHQLQEFQETKEQVVDTSKLLQALESEQLAAARAVAQNQQLKTQLDEMHNAFVSLSNDKLELTEQLQAEKNIGKKFNKVVNDLETELEMVKNQLAEKEVALLEFEKNKLRYAQVEDQIQHYQAHAHHASTLQQELTKAMTTIELLKKENQRLNEQINVQLQPEIVSKNSVDVINETNVDNNQQQTLEGDIKDSNSEPLVNTEMSDTRIRKISTETQTSTQGDMDESFYIPEPLKKLEVKFKQTMEQVAELTDEKQRLEHLVMQLQGETDTIGEYIALYQYQRSILQEKAKEKEKSYKSLVDQRNQLQEQLHKLKVLVADLIHNKMKCSVDINQLPTAVSSENNVEEKPEPTTVVKQTPIIDIKDKTTSEILDLLTEIKDCNDASNLMPDFHPCPWCSGKLITV